MIVASVTADNASALTLTGTRTYVVGRSSVVVIDPGPAAPAHVAAVRSAVADRPVEAILLTHAHADHSAAAEALSVESEAPLLASRETLSRLGVKGSAAKDGDRIEWDSGLQLVVVETPGHSSDHLAYLLLPGREVFTGDLVLGAGTSVILYPDGNLADYMASLARLAALRPGRLWPGHGDPVEDGAARVAEYRKHRLERSVQILDAVRDGADNVSEIRRVVYGDLPSGLNHAAEASLCAHLEHLRSQGEDVPGIQEGFRFNEDEA